MGADEARLRELVRQAYIDGFNNALNWRAPPPGAGGAAEVWLRRNARAFAAALPSPPAAAEAPTEALDQLDYQPAQAARILGISRSYLWKCIKAGKIPTYRNLGLTMIRAEDLRSARDAAWLKRPSEAAAARPPLSPGRSRNTPTMRP